MDALKEDGCERIFTEKTSGAKDDRHELQRALDVLSPVRFSLQFVAVDNAHNLIF